MINVTADIVIGSNFGDEGKGVLTDFYAAPYGSKTLVVRHNGGAQAGHTVTTPDGKRHVFHHVGAGAFAGAATYLSRHFLFNPVLFTSECEVLQSHGIAPRIYADERALVTTPYDMAINQIVETGRGTKRHGSCGMGIGETVERSLHPEFTITLADLEDFRGFVMKLARIRREWLPRRLQQLGVSSVGDWKDILESNTLLENFVNDVAQMMQTVQIVRGLPTSAGFKHIVCEGAQGLMLDQDHAFFPHVTRSVTGATNAFEVLDEAGITQRTVTYVTRAYLTRHGAGPLPHETDGKPFANIFDPTNVPNAYQGALRFALLDIDLLADTIRNDRARSNNTAPFRLAVTCLDQVDNHMRYICDGREVTATPMQFLDHLQQVVARVAGIHELLVGTGPTRDDVHYSVGNAAALSPLPAATMAVA